MYHDDEEVEVEVPAPSVAQPPKDGTTPCLPFLLALVEVLEESDALDGEPEGLSRQESDCSDRQGATGSATVPDRGEVESPAGSAQAPEPMIAAVTSQRRNSDEGRAGARAEAFLATLLNCLWLEPHAASLPRPPREVLRLLSGVDLPFQGGEPTADDRAASHQATVAARHLATRASLVLVLLLLYESEAHPVLASTFANLTDPLLADGSSHRGADRRGALAHEAAAAPLNFTQLLRVMLAHAQEGVYAILLYCLVHRNVSFRRYCLCRVDADEMLVPILEVLNRLPGGATAGAARAGAGGAGGEQNGQNRQSASSSATALLLTLLALTSDKGFCMGASRTRLADGSKVLGHTRPVRDVTTSSLLVAVLLRVAHWNFAYYRNAFFNQVVAGILSNLAFHGVEQLHWYTAGRMLDMAQLLARNALKGQQPKDAAVEMQPATEGADGHEAHRARMVRALLRALARLVSGCLRVPLAARNCTLVYSLQRAYPQQFIALEDDAEIGPPLRHVRAVIEWFQAQCPEGDADGEDSAVQVARLEAAASRLPGVVDALSSYSAGSFAYRETPGASAFFLPEVWSEARRLIPEHVCWSQPTGARAA